MPERGKVTQAALRTPRAAAVAGIAFSLILGVALVLVRLAVPADPNDAGPWIEDGWRNTAVTVALYLVPFAGLAFLWFIGVVRDRIGSAEDRLFATVFFGTGLLFVAMLFISAAAGGALLEVKHSQGSVSDDVWSFGRHSTYLVLVVYGMRMAGAFTIVTTAIATRLRMFPRWLVILGWISAAVLLLAIESFPWGVVLFPLWVLMLSIYFLTHTPAVAPEPVSTSPAGDGT
jgi:hypothetical protein